MKRSLKHVMIALFFSTICFSRCKSQNLQRKYDECINQKMQINAFIQKMESLEKFYLESGLLKSQDANGYLNMIENVTDKKLNTSSLNDYQSKVSFEFDMLYYDFLDCMFTTMIKEETSLKSTNYVQFQTIQEMQGDVYQFAYYKSMINYSEEVNKDFNQIENRILILLGVTYHILYEM